MTSAYLLTAALFFSSVFALAQENAIPNNPPDRTSEQPNILQVIPTDNGQIFVRKGRPLQLDLPIHGQFGDDTLCYTIRSYVVARDKKDSDSVHPVGYSTCQPASRYRLRKTLSRTDASGK